MSMTVRRSIYDLHCHVLPGIDDGCQDMGDSLRLLLKSRRQNVRGIAATPHYYPRETVDQFLDRRREAFRNLKEDMIALETELPRLCLGAEVAYRSGISREPKLPMLCLGGSSYLLLELPFARWEAGVLHEIQEIVHVRGLTPIIAHIERYAHFQDKQTLRDLYEMDVRIQMNAQYVLESATRHKARRLLRSGVIQVMGSDSHGPVHRPPNLGLAAEALTAAGEEDILDEILRQNSQIFQAAWFSARPELRTE